MRYAASHDARDQRVSPPEGGARSSSNHRSRTAGRDDVERAPPVRDREAADARRDAARQRVTRVVRDHIRRDLCSCLARAFRAAAPPPSLFVESRRACRSEGVERRRRRWRRRRGRGEPRRDHGRWMCAAAIDRPPLATRRRTHTVVERRDGDRRRDRDRTRGAPRRPFVTTRAGFTCLPGVNMTRGGAKSATSAHVAADEAATCADVTDPIRSCSRWAAGEEMYVPCFYLAHRAVRREQDHRRAVAHVRGERGGGAGADRAAEHDEPRRRPSRVEDRARGRVEAGVDRRL